MGSGIGESVKSCRNHSIQADEGNPWSVRAENRTCTHEFSLVAASEGHNKGELE
jgi:hypothetical protein